MLSTVTATTFMRKMETGKTSPLLVQCERKNGCIETIVMKLSNRCERKETALAMEAICAMLAIDLNLPMPEPFLVEFDPQFINPNYHRDIFEIASNSSKIAFGTALLPEGYSNAFAFTRAMLQAMTDIFTFDAITLNADRRANNPNCKCKGDSIAIFDHDMCLLMECLGEFINPYPWSAGGLEAMRNGPGRHMFYDELKNKTVTIEALEQLYQNIGQNRFGEYLNALPSEWTTELDTIKTALEYLNKINSNWPQLKLEVQRVLNA